jgi:hypothetical protein
VVVDGTGLLFLPPLLMIVFRQKYPRWWFEWNVQLLRFASRIGGYLVLIDDRYPSTEDEQSVHLSFDYPDAHRGLNRYAGRARDAEHGSRSSAGPCFPVPDQHVSHDGAGRARR